MTAALAIAAIGALLTLSIYALTAERRAGKHEANERVLDEKLKSANEANETLVVRLKDEIRRADALDALLADYAVSGPVIGSHERLLAKWRTNRAIAPNGSGTSAVSVAGAAKPATGPALDTDLLKPGE